MTDRAELRRLAEQMRDTLALMGAQCRAPMWLWDKHCGFVLKAADALEQRAWTGVTDANAGSVRVTDEMVEAALVAYDARRNDYTIRLMRSALEAAIRSALVTEAGDDRARIAVLEAALREIAQPTRDNSLSYARDLAFSALSAKEQGK